jgi:hypothetical protein
MNFSAKWAELVPLMHKFVQRSRVEILRNQHNELTLDIFTTNAPDPPHWTQTHVLVCLEPFSYCMNFGAK